MRKPPAEPLPATFNLGLGEPALRLDAKTGQLVLREYVLAVAAGPDAGKRADLRGTVVVGTHPDAAFTLTDRAVSRFHVELDARADGVRVRDLGSTNGTFLGPNRLGEAFVDASSPVRLRVGQSELAISSAETDVEL